MTVYARHLHYWRRLHFPFSFFVLVPVDSTGCLADSRKDNSVTASHSDTY